MADDPGVIFGNPDTGVGFGDPDTDPQIGLGIPIPPLIQPQRLLCPQKITCPGSDNPITNYSSENIPPFAIPRTRGFIKDGYCCDGSYVSCTSFISEDDATDCLNRLLAQCVICPPPGGSLYTCTAQCASGGGVVTASSNLSQADACARAQALAAAETCPPIQPVTEFCNTQQTCSVPCPDGTSFTFVVPPCTVIGSTQQEADFLAFNLACTRAQKYKMCLGELPRCTCVGSNYLGVLTPSIGGVAPITYSVIGSLPSGLVLLNQQPNTRSCSISGIPTVNGVYTFSIEGIDSQGSTMIKEFTIQVMQITTTVLPDYTIGVPYSAQLSVAGLSGQPAWKISSGNLPDGLTMDLAGHISGTPTATNGTPLTFTVIDQTCDAIDKSFFPPRISLAGNSTTEIRTKRGYPEYVPSTGALYKKITWVGSAQESAQCLQNLPNPNFPIGGSTWTYNGSTEINIFGNFIDNHTKNALFSCPNQPFPIWSAAFQAGIFSGYCFPSDPRSCPACDPTNQANWVPGGNLASPSAFDIPPILHQPGQTVTTPTTLVYNSTANLIAAILGTTLPHAVISGINAQWINLFAAGNYSATLSEEYTDADADASKVVVNGHGLTAQNQPNSRTYVTSFITNRESLITSVTYVLHCSNLIVDQTYNAKITLLDSDGSSTTFTITFTATAATQDIPGGIPLPLPGHTTTALNPQITFAT